MRAVAPRGEQGEPRHLAQAEKMIPRTPLSARSPNSVYVLLFDFLSFQTKKPIYITSFLLVPAMK